MLVFFKANLSERALELLALPGDGVPRLLLDIGLCFVLCVCVCVCEVSFNGKVVHFFVVVGCGSGLSGETLSENGHQWVGLDISQSMLGMFQ